MGWVGSWVWNSRFTKNRCRVHNYMHLSSFALGSNNSALHGRRNIIQQTRRIGLCSVLRPLQHSIGYMGDGFYRSKSRPGGSRTNNFTNQNFYVHISTFVSMTWNPIVLSLSFSIIYRLFYSRSSRSGVWGWVGFWVHRFTWQWVGLGWVSYLVGWVGSGSMIWTHGQLCYASDRLVTLKSKMPV